MAAVFDTTELLEMILMRLDLKTLLLAQHVSEKWNLLINDRDKLQKKLFKQPVASFEEMVALGIEDDDLLVIPLWDFPGAALSVLNPLLVDWPQDRRHQWIQLSELASKCFYPAEKASRSLQTMFMSQPPISHRLIGLGTPDLHTEDSGLLMGNVVSYKENKKFEEWIHDCSEKINEQRQRRAESEGDEKDRLM